jgi:hypothetical protein
MFLAAALSAPAPPSIQKPQLYYPTCSGAKAVYHWSGDGDLTVTFTVIDVKARETVVKVEMVANRDVVVSGSVSVSEDNLTWLDLEKERDDDRRHPLCILKCLTLPGHEWTVQYPSGKRYKFMTREPEKVKVPAGVFECLRVEQEYFGKPECRHTMVWYAPGVGIVKEAVKREDGSWCDSTVLKSFTPGRK